MKVGLLFSGRSTEHWVSVISARTVELALVATGYEVVPIPLGEDGSWRASEEGRRAFDGEVDSLSTGGGASPGSLPDLLDVGVVFPIAHGT